MIVIVEGVDGSGKTTLCKKLSDLGYDQAKINGGTTEFERYKKLKSSYTSEVVVTDRSFITDLVYRSLDEGVRCGMDLYEIMTICKNNVKIIHCVSSTSYRDSMLRGEDNITSKQKSDLIANTYNIIMSMFKKFSNVEIMKYDWRVNSMDEVIKFIEGGTK